MAVVGNDRDTFSLIQLLIGDICRVENFADDTTDLPVPDLVLNVIDVPNAVVRMIKSGAFQSTGSPLILVSAQPDSISDDGVQLADCLVTPARPAEFRATVEARLGRRRGPAAD